MNDYREIMQTKLGKILVALWVLAIIVFIVIALWGFTNNELKGSLAFGILPVATLISIANVLAQVVRKGSEQVALGAWLSVGFGVLLLVLMAVNPAHPEAYRDTEIFIIYSMLTLTFPVFFLVQIAMVPFAMMELAFFGMSADSLFAFYGKVLLMCLSYMLAGYWQWFILLPRIIEKFRKKT